jgi:hypothetical protein
MGCCASAKSSSESFLFYKRYQEAIDRSNLKALTELWQSFPVEKSSVMIDEAIFTVNDMRLSPLAYALWCGKHVPFTFLHKKLGASISEMEKLFADQGKCALEILCIHGSLEVLQYYLPIYLDNLTGAVSGSLMGDVSVSVDFKRSTLVQTKLQSTYTPAHLACENGHVHIINYFNNFFKDRAFVPPYFDLAFQDEHTGENCALIACRKGDYKMVKLLHENCKVNFEVLNKRNENAVMITAASSKRRPNHDFYHLFVYLVEVVKLDIVYNHEEVVLLLEDKNILRFYLNRLQKKGILIEKRLVEKKYEITRPDYPISKEELIIQSQGRDFQIKRCLEETGDNTQSILSSIQDDLRPVTPFLSTFTLDGKTDE